ncbi:MAG: CDP-diacylglycerol--glycerol-3-phosphate 3-phosphatidyltransferase [Firmicutes bacterium]|nr:CDP-diacylglycerol--glycerol-3-phosphate 3-phosphatidyltransferase [Bacillota bacterium]
MNLPTKLTVMRIILVPIFVLAFIFPVFVPHSLFISGSSTASFSGFVALGIFLIACLTDFLDGYLARKLNQVTLLGKFLDPIADKLLVTAALICLIALSALWMLYSVWFAILTICVIIILSRELLICCFRILAASNNVELSADKLGKSKTVFQMTALIFLIPTMSFVYLRLYDMADIIFLIGIILLLISTILTIISGTNYIVKNRHVFKDSDNKDKDEILTVVSFTQNDKKEITNDQDSIICHSEQSEESPYYKKEIGEK